MGALLEKLNKFLSNYIYKLVPSSVYNYIPQDKAGHIVLGIIVGLGVSLVVGNPLYALLVVLGVAIGKELYDYGYNVLVSPAHGVEVLDAAATMVGGLVGVGILELLKIVVHQLV